MTAKAPMKILGHDINTEKGIRELLLDVHRKVCVDGKAPKEVFDVPDSVVEELYSLASVLFKNGKFLEAGEIFRHLLLLQPKSYPYALGFAACTEELKAYAIALKGYTLAALNDCKNPLPLFRAAECAHKLKNKEVEKDFLQRVVQVAGDEKRYSELKEKAALSLKGL